MTDLVFKDINLADLGCATDADSRFNLERTDLVDALTTAIFPNERN